MDKKDFLFTLGDTLTNDGMLSSEDNLAKTKNQPPEFKGEPAEPTQEDKLENTRDLNKKKIFEMVKEINDPKICSSRDSYSAIFCKVFSLYYDSLVAKGVEEKNLDNFSSFKGADKKISEESLSLKSPYAGYIFNASLIDIYNSINKIPLEYAIAIKELLKVVERITQDMASQFYSNQVRDFTINEYTTHRVYWKINDYDKTISFLEYKAVDGEESYTDTIGKLIDENVPDPVVLESEKNN